MSRACGCGHRACGFCVHCSASLCRSHLAAHECSAQPVERLSSIDAAVISATALYLAGSAVVLAVAIVEMML